MFPGPVFFAEMRSSPRKARAFAARFVLGSVLLLVCWAFYRSPDPDAPLTHGQMAALAEGLFLTISLAQGFAVAILTPALVAPAIAQERSRKTLAYLLASRLSSSEIIIGKLTARLIHVFVFLLVGIPIVSLLTTVGGIEPGSIVVSYAISAAVVVFLGGISIAVSTVSPGPREAVFLSYGIAAFWFSLAPVLDGPVRSSFPELTRRIEWAVTALQRTNPLTAPSDVPEDAVILVATLATSGLILVGASVVMLRPAARKLQDGGTRVRRRFRLFRRRAVFDDAMRWKETQVRPAAGLTGRMTNVILFLALVALAIATFRESRETFQETWEFGYGAAGRAWASVSFNQFLRSYGTALYGLVLLAVTTSAACSITSERESVTWTGIAASPLEPREILRAKRAGVYRRLRPLLFCPVAMWTVGVVAGAIHPIGFGFCLALYPAYVVAAASLGTFVSLHCRTTARALTVSIAITLVLHGGYLIACVPVTDGTDRLMACIASTPIAMFLAQMSYVDIQDITSGVGNSGFGHRPADPLLLGLSSFVFYVALACALNVLSIRLFDRVEDRPSVNDPR